MKKIITMIFLTMSSMMIVNAQTNNVQSATKTQIQVKGHEVKGHATYYGDRYRTTRRTANGEIFNKDAYTAAHKTLPFGTIVQVTNLNNNKTVIVRITDRGPFAPGRIIDVTPKAARGLDMIKAGVVPVELAILSMPQKSKN